MILFRSELVNPEHETIHTNKIINEHFANM